MGQREEPGEPVALEDERIGELGFVFGENTRAGEIAVEPLRDVTVDRTAVALEESEPFLEIQDQTASHGEKGKILLRPDDGQSARGEFQVDVVARTLVLAGTGDGLRPCESDFLFQ